MQLHQAYGISVNNLMPITATCWLRGVCSKPGSNTPAPPSAMPSTASPNSSSSAPATSPPSPNYAPEIEQALARISSIETNEVDDDAVDTVLLTTVADLIERVEALEGA